MAASDKEGPIDLDGESYECKDLFVADASCFPTSIGINPMITVECISYMTAKVIIKRLSGDCMVPVLKKSASKFSW